MCLPFDDALQQQNIARRIWQIKRMAIDAPHWFGLSSSEDLREEEAELTQNFGIQLEGSRNTGPGRKPAILLFPNVGTEAQSTPHSRMQHLLEFRTVVNRRTIGIFSLVGGVGVTSIAAALARLLANCGERVMLADAGGHTLLPRYFGGKGSKQGAIRRFDPIPGSENQSIRTVSLDVEPFVGCDEEMDRILQEFAAEASRVDRVIWDLGNAPVDWTARILQPGIRVLVPLLPTAKCLMQLASTEDRLRRIQSSGCSAQWQYVLNHFDELDPAQVEIRARFRAELGDRLLPFILRTSPLVNEALLRGRNIVDHAPASPLVSDLWRLARSVTGTAGPSPVVAPEAWGEV
jgi:cellulose biosynthesis protein BcsQ